jgi:hypothetical protein
MAFSAARADIEYKRHLHSTGGNRFRSQTDPIVQQSEITVAPINMLALWIRANLGSMRIAPPVAPMMIAEFSL